METTVNRQALRTDIRWRRYETTAYRIECHCPGTLVEEEEEECGDWMRIAHTSIVGKMLEFLDEWKEVYACISLGGQGLRRNGRSDVSWQDMEWMIQRESQLTRCILEQLQELANFEELNVGKHCKMDVRPILEEHGWTWLGCVDDRDLKTCSDEKY